MPSRRLKQVIVGFQYLTDLVSSISILISPVEKFALVHPLKLGPYKWRVWEKERREGRERKRERQKRAPEKR
jgi:hypothetical protein